MVWYEGMGACESIPPAGFVGQQAHPTKPFSFYISLHHLSEKQPAQHSAAQRTATLLYLSLFLSPLFLLLPSGHLLS
jgi:hypothetical protein